MTTTVRDRVGALKARMRLPVIAAPMFLVSGPDLVLGACDAGIMGALPGPNGRTIGDLAGWFERIEAHFETARADGRMPAPWAFNMITHTSYHRFDAELDLIARHGPELVITALGGPHRVTDVVHGYGGLVFADVNAPAYARKALDKGADGLVLVCSGAGGHTGEYALLAFIDEVRNFFDGPIAVGGAIGTGRAVRAVELLGADFAYMGTRFIPATESLASVEYRQMTVECRMDDLVASRAITGALGNWMRPSLARAGIDLEMLKSDAKIDFSGDMHANAKAWKHVWSAGHGVGSVTAAEPVATIVDRLAAEYVAAVDHQYATVDFALRNGWARDGNGRLA
jgi:nitronate monooxygenase